MSLIMVAGPYSSGGADAAQRSANLTALNAAAVALFQRGHTPVIGVNMALPMIAASGAASHDAIMMPLSLALADQCHAVLRIGGPSAGADAEVARIRDRGGAVYTDLDAVPEGRI